MKLKKIKNSQYRRLYHCRRSGTAGSDGLLPAVLDKNRWQWSPTIGGSFLAAGTAGVSLPTVACRRFQKRQQYALWNRQQ